nr:unnamed protein product [Callosobruchus analis]
MFSLPSVRTLQEYINHIILRSGIEDSIFDVLERKVSSFKDIENYAYKIQTKLLAFKIWGIIIENSSQH